MHFERASLLPALRAAALLIALGALIWLWRSGAREAGPAALALLAAIAARTLPALLRRRARRRHAERITERQLRAVRRRRWLEGGE